MATNKKKAPLALNKKIPWKTLSNAISILKGSISKISRQIHEAKGEERCQIACLHQSYQKSLSLLNIRIQ